MRIFALVIGLLLLGAAAVSLARSGTSGDGGLDRRELVATGLFQDMDRNGDGLLSASEFTGAAALYAEWDADGDFRLSEDEFYWAAFHHADVDRDGALSPAEFESLLRLLAAPPAQEQQPAAGPAEQPAQQRRITEPVQRTVVQTQ